MIPTLINSWEHTASIIHLSKKKTILITINSSSFSRPSLNKPKPNETKPITLVNGRERKTQREKEGERGKSDESVAHPIKRCNTRHGTQQNRESPHVIPSIILPSFLSRF
jgi:hypothetical protein